MDGILKVFSPVEVLRKLYDIDPVSARFLTGGLGVFAAAQVPHPAETERQGCSFDRPFREGSS